MSAPTYRIPDSAADVVDEYSYTFEDLTVTVTLYTHFVSLGRASQYKPTNICWLAVVARHADGKHHGDYHVQQYTGRNYVKGAAEFEAMRIADRAAGVAA